MESYGPGKNKRKWNDAEDSKLIEAMIDVLHSGGQFKSDNGFKAGFYNAMENRLATLLPDSGFKARPHIESPVKTLKSDWSAVHDMLNWKATSGFGWDHENKMLDAPTSVWVSYAQVHTNTAKWRGRAFPHYMDLCLVFGKNRATGQDAQTVADIAYEIYKEHEENPDHTQASEDEMEEMPVDPQLNNPSHIPTREESSTNQKRKRSNSGDALAIMLKESVESLGSRFEDSTNRLTSVLRIESDREELHKKLHAEMKKVIGFTLRECNKAVGKLARNDDLLVIFFEVGEEEKLEWVQDLLAGNI